MSPKLILKNPQSKDFKYRLLALLGFVVIIAIIFGLFFYPTTYSTSGDYTTEESGGLNTIWIIFGLLLLIALLILTVFLLKTIPNASAKETIKRRISGITLDDAEKILRSQFSSKRMDVTEKTDSKITASYSVEKTVVGLEVVKIENGIELTYSLPGSRTFNSVFDFLVLVFLLAVIWFIAVFFLVDLVNSKNKKDRIIWDSATEITSYMEYQKNLPE